MVVLHLKKSEKPGTCLTFVIRALDVVCSLQQSYNRSTTPTTGASDLTIKFTNGYQTLSGDRVRQITCIAHVALCTPHLSDRRYNSIGSDVPRGRGPFCLK
jgi:hypothetical protein